MRLTYRTVRVLAAMAAEPGRLQSGDLAAKAGVHRSRARYRSCSGASRDWELIENHGGGHARGGANAWRLTPKGAAIHRALGERLA